MCFLNSVRRGNEVTIESEWGGDGTGQLHSLEDSFHWNWLIFKSLLLAYLWFSNSIDFGELRPFSQFCVQNWKLMKQHTSAAKYLRSGNATDDCETIVLKFIVDSRRVSWREILTALVGYWFLCYIYLFFTSRVLHNTQTLTPEWLPRIYLWLLQLLNHEYFSWLIWK